MFEEVSKIFSRGFLVGFFLPGVLFIAGNILLFGTFFPQYIPSARLVLENFANIGYGPATILAAWVLGVMLVAGNRMLIRFIEGYHLLGNTPLLWWQRRRFDKLEARIAAVVAQGHLEKKRAGEVSKRTEQLYDRLILKRIAAFPKNKDSVLATAFGNTIRAFEEYSYNVYQIDAIPVWPRMMAVVPDEFKNVIGDAKSQVDASINIFYLSLLLGVESICAARIAPSTNILWLVFPGLCLVVAILSYQMALSAARQWGETVKSVFDLYRYDLLDKLGVKPAASWEKELEQWERLNQTFLYQYSPDKLKRTDREQHKSRSAKGGKDE